MAKKVEKSKSSKEEKNNIFNYITTFLTIIIIVLIIAIIIVLIAKRNNLDTSSELVTELHNYFVTSNLTDCSGMQNYADSEVKYADLDSSYKLCIAYQKANIPEDSEKVSYKTTKKKNTCTENDMVFRAEDDENTCEVTKIERDVIDNSYLKIFGTEIEDNESFKIDNYNICYLNDEYYYCGLSETFTYTIGNESTIYRIINKAVEKSDKIEIYDYFVKLNSETCFKYYTTTTTNSDCTEAYDGNETNITTKFVTKYGTLYKHIYEKAQDGTYYWVSSEPIK